MGAPSQALAGIGYQVPAQTYYNAIATAGGTITSASQVYFNHFVTLALRDGVWSTLQMFNPQMGTDLSAALTNAVGTNATNTNFLGVGTDYIETGSTGGLKGDGSTKRLNTNYNPSTAGTITTSSCVLFVYVSGSGSGGTTIVDIGNIGAATNFTEIGWFNGGTVEGGRVGTTGAAGEDAPATNATSSGFHLVSTNGSRSQQFYANGSAVGSPVTASASFQSNNLFASAIDNNGTATSFSNRYARGYGVATGWTSTQVTNFAADYNWLQTALTRNTY